MASAGQSGLARDYSPPASRGAKAAGLRRRRRARWRAGDPAPRRLPPPAARGRARPGAAVSAGAPPPGLAPIPDWLRGGSAPSQGAGPRRLQSGEGHGARRRAPPSSVPPAALGPQPRGPPPAVRRPPPPARAGNHGGSERATGPLPHGGPGRRPGGHGVRRGRRAALPDRAEVSARGPRGLGPPLSARPGRSGTARRLPAREAAAWRWGPGLCAHAPGPAPHARVPLGAGLGIFVVGKRPGGWVRGSQECGAGEDGQRVGYKLPPPRRRAPAEPRDLRGRPTPTPAPTPCGRVPRRWGLRSCPPSARLGGHTLRWTDTSRHFLVGVRRLGRCSNFTGAQSESRPRQPLEKEAQGQKS